MIAHNASMQNAFTVATHKDNETNEKKILIVMLEWARQHFVRNATNALEHKQKHTLRDEYTKLKTFGRQST